MIASNLLILTHYTLMKMFLEDVSILTLCANITFEKYEKVLQYDLENASEDLKINENWKPKYQVTINQRRKQLE